MANRLTAEEARKLMKEQDAGYEYYLDLALEGIKKRAVEGHDYYRIDFRGIFNKFKKTNPQQRKRLVKELRGLGYSVGWSESYDGEPMTVDW